MSHWHRMSLRMDCGCEDETLDPSTWAEWIVGEWVICATHGETMIVRVSRSGCK